MSNYDKKLIDSRLESFKQQNYKRGEVSLYFDMDNTLCLFSPFGDTETSMKAAYSKGFYRDLPIFPEAPAVLENLQNLGYKVRILSSCIDSPYCRPEKKAWVKYHLPFIEEEDILLLPVGQDKSTMIDDPKKSILIDDYYKNIVDMYESGGIGVKKTYSGKQRPIPQVGNLVDIFSVLSGLNCL